MSPGDEALKEKGEAGGDEREADQIQPARTGDLVARQGEPSETNRHQADRHVDEKDPAPAEFAQNDAAQTGAEHLADHDRHGGDTDDPRHVTAGVTRHHHLHHRRQQPAGDALQQPAQDQHLNRRGEPAERRACDEPGEATEKNAPRADAVDQPTAQWQRQGEREQIAGGHPLDRSESHAERVAQSVQRHIDHGGIETRHQRPAGACGRDDPDPAVDAIGLTHSPARLCVPTIPDNIVPTGCPVWRK
jgi:hypothetical protein